MAAYGVSSRSSRLPLRSAICLALFSVVTASIFSHPRPATAQDAVAEVTADQLVTIVGQFQSLEGLISDLAWKANVSVLSYDAQDRPTTLRLEKQPLHAALRSILRNESYLVGLRAADDGSSRVHWLRVVGDSETARSRHSLVREATGRRDLWLPPDLISAAFSNPDPAAQQAALQEISSQITGDDKVRAAFLRTDAAAMANLLRQYPQARSVLESMRGAQADPALSAKLAAIIALLR